MVGTGKAQRAALTEALSGIELSGPTKEVMDTRGEDDVMSSGHTRASSSRHLQPEDHETNPHDRIGDDPRRGCGLPVEGGREDEEGEGLLTVGEAKSSCPLPSGSPVPADSAGSFDLLIASDVIYSASVVKPLFDTVGGLLAGLGGERREGEGRGVETSKPGQQQQLPAVSLQRQPVGDCSVDNITREGLPSPLPLEHVYNEHRPGCEGSNNSNISTTSRSTRCKNAATGVAHRICNTSTCGELYDGITATAVAVFVMSQSFGYDSKTEEAIDRACAEHGLARQVVWDELLPAGTHLGSLDVAANGLAARNGSGSVDAGGTVPDTTRVVENGETEEHQDGDCLGNNSELLVWGKRAGTKLQLFRRI